jgi:Family of unknown function (DUF6441)
LGAPGSGSGSPTAGARHYPNRKLDAASLVYTKAPQIVRAFDEGAVIRSRRGRFLAIPTENAPRKGTDRRRISPSTFPEHTFGPLRFVPRQSGPSLLVVDGLQGRSAARPESYEASGATPTPRWRSRPRRRAAELRFRGAKNNVGRVLTVTLTNDLDGTAYA